ncbi:hypothetical protein Poli38472_006626 [Pythium oligandrum]|uniref:C2H2-type domain-containing protein n=1 Tax=Pythium oligandrum TaxID=41045 RepID=A0A8K1C4X8_PYTOL|nr:hypothetical protein Poli38472_006626 [Pythium oligandrum]|eukprot:TMW56616.1 hypothetical protein Poli38472_006626 [Pythium oligandrum]
MGPAAAAMFAGYQPSGSKSLPNMAKTKGLTNLRGNAAMASMMPWADATSPSSAGFNADAINMLSMAAQPPPALPFVSFNKNLPSMPWMNATADVMNFGLNDEQIMVEDVKLADSNVMIDVPRRNAEEDFEAAELEELLDFSMPDDAESAEKDKEDLINLDDGFDGTEMSILYSFLVDTPEDKTSEKKALNVESDDGILNLNMLANTPIESLMESLEEDFTDDELKMTPPHHDCKGIPEVKSRRLCKAEGCYKRSRSNGLCISHGGGRRCAVDGCDKSSQGGNLCIRHGGGKRCSYEGCDKAAQSNFLCKAHGGGPRCQVDGCSRSSQGGGFCRSHGGGKRCMFDGCTKGTQRGDYCALHGGSRLCEVPGCMRNDRGGGLCATHGGGKRCLVENCGKPCRRKGLCSAHLRQAEHTK